MQKFNSNVPTGPLENRWEKHKFDFALIAPQNRKKYNVIVIGTGLAGASLCATLGEAGYNVQSFCYNDSPRRAHSIAAQGGVNASKNYQNDGDSTWRLFYDTIKGGDFRARESNIYRLAQLSCNIIDQAVSQGVPFAREYSGYLANRSFGGTQVSRTFYARGQTGQQLLLGAYSSMSKEIASGRVKHKSRCEMLEVILIDGKARGIVIRDLTTGKISSHTADCVVMCTGGYSNAYYLSTNAKGCNTSATWRAHKNGAYFANPSFTQIHPTCVPPTGDSQSKLTLMSESLRNDGRIWAPKNKEDCDKSPNDIAEEDRDYFLERMYPAFANLVPRDIASRALKGICDEGRGIGSVVNNQRLGVYLDFSSVIQKMGTEKVKEKYGNLFDMYKSITGENPYEVPMKIYPAPHYTMGGLWVDYNLMTTIDGLFACGESNFSDHGANRLGASALMQGLADGYFVAPQTVANYLARGKFEEVNDDHPEVLAAVDSVKSRIDSLMNAPDPQHSPDYFHRKIGSILWTSCGMARDKDSLKNAIASIEKLKADFWQKIKVTGVDKDFNQTLEKAGRVADFIELGHLMCVDALDRDESCGAHARLEYLAESGDAMRDDENFGYVAAWEFSDDKPVLHKEQLDFEFIKPTYRDYK
ncbi:fumarate reductase/succinate dehydrogenase flavoprotein subunit [Candidatus Pseudothioglobus singularis]|nr:fumarate reductase/succinate dehydrogenase flavoprotein subunit [Candidatus Pseudothioglobus singularis]MDB4822854.1 fumarate reductase/succinate dehydrogenase flavoprotein subunit [Candidatus Pseudothioglobus singularis]